MSTTSKEIALAAFESIGTNDARGLRERASTMDGTALIAEETKVPYFDPNKDYTDWPVGAPVLEDVEGSTQLFTLIQPHNAGNYPGSTPSNTPALWSIRHTKDPVKAKPFLPAQGTSGMYEIDECCTDAGHVWRSKVGSNVYSPTDYAQNWDDLGTIEDVQGGGAA